MAEIKSGVVKYGVADNSFCIYGAVFFAALYLGITDARGRERGKAPQ